MKIAHHLLVAVFAVAASSAQAAVTIHRVWHEGYADAGQGHRVTWVAGCPSGRAILDADGRPALASAAQSVGSSDGLSFHFLGALEVRTVFNPAAYNSGITAGTTIWFEIEVTGQTEVATITGLSLLHGGLYNDQEGGRFAAHRVDSGGNAFPLLQSFLPPGRYFVRLGTGTYKRGDYSGFSLMSFEGSISFSNMTLALGATQGNPILPTPIEPQPGEPPGSAGGSFTQVPAQRWYDPPLAQGYTFTATGTALFKHIMAFPTGIRGSYYVTTEGTEYGPFTPEQSVDLLALRGHGVSSFVVRGIKPFVDATSPVAFPIMLDFTEATADFTMVPIAAPDLQMETEANGDLKFTFSGVLQSSPDLNTWTDMTPAPTSPYIIPKAQATGTRFFRSRDP